MLSLFFSVSIILNSTWRVVQYLNGESGNCSRFFVFGGKEPTL